MSAPVKTVTKAPDLRTQNVPLDRLRIVGIDEPLTEANADYYDAASLLRLPGPEGYWDGASEQAINAMLELQESIEKQGLLAPIGVDIVEGQDGSWAAYVIDGRRRVHALRQLAQGAGTLKDEAAVEAYGTKVRVYTLPKAVSRADAAVALNEVRYNYDFEAQVRIAFYLRSQGMEKEKIAARLGVSPNHIDKLCRVAESVPGLLAAMKTHDLGTGEVFELSWACDSDVQSEIIELYLKWRECGYCTRKAPGALQMAKNYRNLITEAGRGQHTDPNERIKYGFSVVSQELEANIQRWLYGEQDKSTVRTIDDADPEQGGGGRREGGGEGSATNQEQDSDLPVYPDQEVVEPEGQNVEPPSEKEAAPPSTNINPLVKATKADMRELLEGNYMEDGEARRYIDDLKPEAAALLRWIYCGQLPIETGKSSDNSCRGLIDFLKRRYPDAMQNVAVKALEAGKVKKGGA